MARALLIARAGGGRICSNNSMKAPLKLGFASHSPPGRMLLCPHSGWLHLRLSPKVIFSKWPSLPTPFADLDFLNVSSCPRRHIHGLVFYSLWLAPRQRSTGSLCSGSFQIRSSPSSLYITLPYLAIVCIAKHHTECLLIGYQELQVLSGVFP